MESISWGWIQLKTEDSMHRELTVQNMFMNSSCEHEIFPI